MSIVRSHLAANQFFAKLVDWVARYPRPVFTYVDVSYAFSMTHNSRYVMKMLSRLARRRLLQARRVSRYGTARGFMNQYRVTMRGWHKAAYLGARFAGNELPQTLQPLPANPTDDFANTIGLCHLALGKGAGREWTLGLDRTLSRRGNNDLGGLLCWLDPQFIPVEMLCNLSRPFERREMRLLRRTAFLQESGFTPTGVAAPQYAQLASSLGRPDHEIIIALLYRRCRELQTKVESSQQIQLSTQTKPHLPEPTQTRSSSTRSENLELELIQHFLSYLDQTFFNSQLLLRIGIESHVNAFVHILLGYPMRVDDNVRKMICSWSAVFAKMLSNMVKNQAEKICDDSTRMLIIALQSFVKSRKSSSST